MRRTTLAASVALLTTSTALVPPRTGAGKIVRGGRPLGPKFLKDLGFEKPSFLPSFGSGDDKPAEVQLEDVEPAPLGPANAAAGAVFALLVTWSFGFAPGDLGNPADTQLIELLVTQPVPRPESVNELWFAVWNSFAVVPLAIAALTLPAASRGQRLPAAPFLVGSAAFGYFALGPYFTARSARTEAPLAPEEDFGFFTKNVFETRAFGVALAALAASIPFSSDLLAADPSQVISGFLDLFASSRFVAVASADIGIMSVLAALLVAEDAARRGWDAYRVPLAAASLLLPVLGPSLYLAARPRIASA